MKRGFSLLTAIIFLVLISTISILSLSLSSQSRKQITDGFLYLQAEVLARSATEYALLAISGHDFNTSCLENINIRYPSNDSNYTHEMNISISYIGTSMPCNNSHILDNNISTSESNRTVIIDTIVTSNPNLSSEPVKIHRRTIQKP